MLKNFESITSELSQFELEYVEYLGQWFMANQGKKNTLKNQDISKMIKLQFDRDVSDSRVRKVVQFLRMNGFPNLIASGKGYFYAENEGEIENWVISLRQRESAIKSIREQAERHLEIIKIRKYAINQMSMF